MSATAQSFCGTLKKATNIFWSKLDLTMLSLPQILCFQNKTEISGQRFLWWSLWLNTICQFFMLDKVSQLCSGRIAVNWAVATGDRAFTQQEGPDPVLLWVYGKTPTSREARFRLIQLFQLAFGFVGRRAAACVICQNRRKMFERIRVPGFGQLHLLFTLHTTNV